MDKLTGALWRKSSYSGGNGGGCVEVARNLPGVIGVRDSKNPAGPELAFPPATWSEFIEGIKNSKLDL